jgi:aryl-alcohol dehydrogenase-like predicted oxidoreductase
MPELHAQRDYVNQAGLSRAAIFNAVDASLQRLGTTYIDLLQIHQFDAKTPVEETMRALHDLVQSGKVRYIGASCMPCWKFAYMNEVAGRNGWTRFVSVHNEHSLLYREEVRVGIQYWISLLIAHWWQERELIPYCDFHGIGIIPWAPLAHGDLARPLEATDSSSMKPSDKLIISRVEELAHKKGCTMSQITLLWSATKVTSPVISGSSVQRLDDSLFGGLTLDEDEVKYLDELYVPSFNICRDHAQPIS